MRKPYLHEQLQQHFITMVAAGESHTLALSSSGTVYGCGSNEEGQLGLGDDVKESLVMRKIPLPAKCNAIAAGPSGSMFNTEDGKIYVCGNNDMGQLGLGLAFKAKKKITTATPLPNAASGVVTYSLDFGGYKPSETGAQSKLMSRSMTLQLSTARHSSEMDDVESLRTNLTTGIKLPEKQRATCKCCVVM
jgi:hypothetical protein